MDECSELRAESSRFTWTRVALLAMESNTTLRVRCTVGTQVLRLKASTYECVVGWQLFRCCWVAARGRAFTLNPRVFRTGPVAVLCGRRVQLYRTSCTVNARKCSAHAHSETLLKTHPCGRLARRPAPPTVPRRPAVSKEETPNPGGAAARDDPPRGSRHISSRRYLPYGLSSGMGVRDITEFDLTIVGEGFTTLRYTVMMGGAVVSTDISPVSRATEA